MQPNDQQGYYRPEQPQPTAPGPVPPQPAATPTVAVPVEQPIAPAVADSMVAPSAEQEDYDASDDQPVTWVAHEYIHQEKGTTWFIIFAIVIVVFLAISIFLMKSWSFAALLAVITVVVIVYSRRPPRELTYALNDDGLLIDQKLHRFEDFKSFGVIRDGEEFSVMLIPTQRFQPGVTVYFPEEAGEDIVDMLGSRLPMKDLKLDAVDRLVRLLRL